MRKKRMILSLALSVFFTLNLLPMAYSNAESDKQETVIDETTAIKIAAQQVFSITQAESTLMDEPNKSADESDANEPSQESDGLDVDSDPAPSPLPEIAPYDSAKESESDSQVHDQLLSSEKKLNASWSDFTIQGVVPIYSGSERTLAFCVTLQNSSGNSGYVIVGAQSELPPIMEYSLDGTHISSTASADSRVYYVSPTVYALGAYQDASVSLYGCEFKKQELVDPSYEIVDGVWESYIESASTLEYEEASGRVTQERIVQTTSTKVIIRYEWNDVYEPSGNGYYHTGDFDSPPNTSVQPQVTYTNHCGPTSAMNLALFYLRKNAPTVYPFTSDYNALDGWTTGTWGTAVSYFGVMHNDVKNNQWLGNLPGTIGSNYASGIRTYFTRQGATVITSSRLSANDIDYKRIINDWRLVPLLNYFAQQTGYNWHWITGFGWREEVWRWSNTNDEYRDFYAKVNNGWNRASNTYVYCGTRTPSIPPNVQYTIGDYIVDFKIQGGSRYN